MLDQRVQRRGNAGATGGATGCATPGQRRGNGGATLSPYPYGVAPAFEGGANAEEEGSREARGPNSYQRDEGRNGMAKQSTRRASGSFPVYYGIRGAYAHDFTRTKQTRKPKSMTFRGIQPVRLTTKIQGDLRLSMETEVRIAKMAAMGAVAGVAAAIKADWRDQIVRAGLGDRLAKSVRSETYPKGKSSLNAAGMVWSKAKKIIGAFETGVEIRAKNGRWLAIPLPAAGTGRGNSRFTPGEWERRRGIKLRFVYRPSGNRHQLAPNAAG